ncbi:MAG TPA: hypothetical protein VKQ27_08445 [Acetobacteraceae bacterium]|nr:hypothetical protein [Acetobacteraceae bacterium]
MRSGNDTAFTAIALLIAMHAHAETPAAFCQRVGTDDTTRPIPEVLVPEVNTAFGTSMPARMVMDTTVYRCAAGHVLACTVGANLPCGKADASRTPGEGLVQWCRANPDAASIPAAVTGHDTLYEWSCHAGTPGIVRQTLHADPRGFVAEFWKRLP